MLIRDIFFPDKDCFKTDGKVQLVFLITEWAVSTGNKIIMPKDMSSWSNVIIREFRLFGCIDACPARPLIN